MDKPHLLKVVETKEHEDGSATYSFDLDEEAAVYAAQVGLEFMLYCAAAGVDMQDALAAILKMKETHDEGSND